MPQSEIYDADHLGEPGHAMPESFMAALDQPAEDAHATPHPAIPQMTPEQMKSLKMLHFS